MQETHLIFYGEVQGVGFRVAAKRLADQLELYGFARNLMDGTVEICVQGDSAAIDMLVSHLETRFAITKIKRVSLPMKSRFLEFTIQSV